MVNRNGHPASLVPQRGNTHGAKHGAYSARMREPRALELVEEIMQLRHTVNLDRVGALEIARVVALCESLDDAIAQKGVAKAATLVDLRLRAHGRLIRTLSAYGLTPEARADWAGKLGRPTLGEEIARGMRELEEAREHGD